MIVSYYTSESGRSQPADFLRELAVRFRIAIMSDLEALRLHGDKAPVQTRTIKGARPMFEIKTDQYRTLCVRTTEEIVVLHICKKQDQKRGIEVARKRMSEILEG